MKYLAIFLALFMLASPVYAQDNGGGEGNNTGCNGQGNPNSPCDPGDDGGTDPCTVDCGTGGTGTNTNTNTNDNTSTATGGSVGDTTATGGNATVIIGGSSECYEGECEGGEGTLNSNAENNVDVSNESESNSTSDATVNNSGNTAVDVVVQGSTYQAAHRPVNSAAPVYSGICNSGASGTGRNLSLSFAVTSDVCMDLMMADAMSARGNMEQVDYWLDRAAKHAKWKGRMGTFRSIITLGIL